MVRLGPSEKIKLPTWIEPTISRSVYVSPTFLRPQDKSDVQFCAVNIRLKEANSKRESEQNALHERHAFTITQYWFTFGVLYRLENPFIPNKQTFCDQSNFFNLHHFVTFWFLVIYQSEVCREFLIEVFLARVHYHTKIVIIVKLYIIFRVNKWGQI